MKSSNGYLYTVLFVLLSILKLEASEDGGIGISGPDQKFVEAEGSLRAQQDRSLAKLQAQHRLEHSIFFKSLDDIKPADVKKVSDETKAVFENQGIDLANMTEEQHQSVKEQLNAVHQGSEQDLHDEHEEELGSLRLQHEMLSGQQDHSEYLFVHQFVDRVIQDGIPLMFYHSDSPEIRGLFEELGVPPTDASYVFDQAQELYQARFRRLKELQSRLKQAESRAKELSRPATESRVKPKRPAPPKRTLDEDSDEEELTPLDEAAIEVEKLKREIMAQHKELNFNQLADNVQRAIRANKEAYKKAKAQKGEVVGDVLDNKAYQELSLRYKKILSDLGFSAGAVQKILDPMLFTRDVLVLRVVGVLRSSDESSVKQDLIQQMRPAVVSEVDWDSIVKDAQKELAPKEKKPKSSKVSAKISDSEKAIRKKEAQRWLRAKGDVVASYIYLHDPAAWDDAKDVAEKFKLINKILPDLGMDQVGYYDSVNFTRDQARNGLASDFVVGIDKKMQDIRGKRVAPSVIEARAKRVVEVYQKQHPDKVTLPSKEYQEWVNKNIKYVKWLYDKGDTRITWNELQGNFESGPMVAKMLPKLPGKEGLPPPPPKGLAPPPPKAPPPPPGKSAPSSLKADVSAGSTGDLSAKAPPKGLPPPPPPPPKGGAKLPPPPQAGGAKAASVEAKGIEIDKSSVDDEKLVDAVNWKLKELRLGRAVRVRLAKDSKKPVLTTPPAKDSMQLTAPKALGAESPSGKLSLSPPPKMTSSLPAADTESSAVQERPALPKAVPPPPKAAPPPPPIKKAAVVEEGSSALESHSKLPPPPKPVAPPPPIASVKPVTVVRDASEGDVVEGRQSASRRSVTPPTPLRTPDPKLPAQQEGQVRTVAVESIGVGSEDPIEKSTKQKPLAVDVGTNPPESHMATTEVQTELEQRDPEKAKPVMVDTAVGSDDVIVSQRDRWYHRLAQRVNDQLNVVRDNFYKTKAGDWWAKRRIKALARHNTDESLKGVLENKPHLQKVWQGLDKETQRRYLTKSVEQTAKSLRQRALRLLPGKRVQATA